MSTDLLKRIPFLYHFTDRRNLDLIREFGGLSARGDAAQRDYGLCAGRE